MAGVTRTVAPLEDRLREVTSALSGVVSVSRGGHVEYERAFGLADRAHGVVNTTETRFGIAAGTTGFTAVTIVALIGEGVLSMATTARSLLGQDLPLVHPEVTVAHLLGHASGVADYLGGASGGDDYVVPVPVHTLADTEGYLPALAERTQRFAPGTRFEYSNSGYVLLALLAERAAGDTFPALVGRTVFAPAEMRQTAFLRSDRLPGSAAVGYLGDGRTNLLHLPVRGSGDSGAYTTAGDLRKFWSALFGERIVPRHRLVELLRPRQDVPERGLRSGLGFWLHRTGPAVSLEGCAAGVSFRSVHDPSSGQTHTVLANTGDGAWPVTRRLDELLR